MFVTNVKCKPGTFKKDTIDYLEKNKKYLLRKIYINKISSTGEIQNPDGMIVTVKVNQTILVNKSMTDLFTADKTPVLNAIIDGGSNVTLEVEKHSGATLDTDDECQLTLLFGDINETK